ncbi:hypothetical protein ZHAS_00009487 [Anopheles sinensis]|uniref:Uncharacterized protein n=1 Tax=Anopheles sinensis TaxID=74873 RepID=A0A084VVD1_ANOSI|nr:hypothetical protein ZHAS_00009487 [Anopheles sinensis]
MKFIPEPQLSFQLRFQELSLLPDATTTRTTTTLTSAVNVQLVSRFYPVQTVRTGNRAANRPAFKPAFDSKAKAGGDGLVTPRYGTRKPPTGFGRRQTVTRERTNKRTNERDGRLVGSQERQSVVWRLLRAFAWCVLTFRFCSV